MNQEPAAPSLTDQLTKAAAKLEFFTHQHAVNIDRQYLAEFRQPDDTDELKLDTPNYAPSLDVARWLYDLQRSHVILSVPAKNLDERAALIERDCQTRRLMYEKARSRVEDAKRQTAKTALELQAIETLVRILEAQISLSNRS